MTKSNETDSNTSYTNEYDLTSYLITLGLVAFTVTIIFDLIFSFIPFEFEGGWRTKHGWPDGECACPRSSRWITTPPAFTVGFLHAGVPG